AGGGTVLAIENLDGLVALAQAGALEIHPWGCTVGDMDHPDRLIFDLDPGPGIGWRELADATREVRDRLAARGLRSFLKTTGGKGLHVVAPIAPERDWEDVKAFARGIAAAMAADKPGRYVANMSKSARAGHIFVDYLRNGRGQTAIAPYSTRARPGAPVATPLAWEELARDVRGDHFRLANWARRADVDPWAEFLRIEQR